MISQISFVEIQPRRRFSRTNPRLGFQPSHFLHWTARGRKKRSCYPREWSLTSLRVARGPSRLKHGFDSRRAIGINDLQFPDIVTAASFRRGIDLRFP